MGKVIALINTTPDGFCDSHYVTADAEFHEFVHGLLKDTQTVGFGRNTFELFQNVWPPILEKQNQPESQVRMAQALHRIDKNVYSATLQSTLWHNSAIVKKINSSQVKLFKESNEKNLLTIGSPGIVASLTQQNLVDEYYFSMQPTIAGHGAVRLFDKIRLDSRQPLKLMNATQLQSGVVIIHYLKIGK